MMTGAAVANVKVRAADCYRFPAPHLHSLAGEKDHNLQLSGLIMQ